MLVISNTSPLMNLSVAGQVHLLEKLYGKIVIPQSVRDELSHIAARGAEMPSLQNAAWLEIVPVKDKERVELLMIELDAGEAEVIALAMELKADLVLLDERRARKVAARVGLKVMGLLGVLMDAKRKIMIDAVKPILDAMMDEAGFWVGSELYERVVREAGE